MALDALRLAAEKLDKRSRERIVIGGLDSGVCAHPGDSVIAELRDLTEKLAQELSVKSSLI